MEKTFLSFIIPVYNVEKYIGECLDSLLNQDVDKTEYEIICINDGSPDNSAEIIKNYAEKYSNIRLINKENGGVSSARNLGLKEAKGDYIWFVDSDDIICPNCVGKIVNFLKKSLVDTICLKYKNFYDKPNFEKINFTFTECNNISKLFDFVTCSTVCVNIFKKDFLIQNNLFFGEKLIYSEDVFYTFRTRLKVNSIAKTGDVYYYYRKRPGSAIMTVSKNIDKHIDSMWQLCVAYNELSKECVEKYKKDICLLKRDQATKALLFDLYKKGNIKEAKAWLRRLKENKFYPYRLKFRWLIGNKSIREFANNYLCFLFPFKPYFYMCVAFKSLKKRLKRSK